MPSIEDWNTDAASNNSASPNGFPENMNYSDVNNSSREVMAVLARYYKDNNGSLNATGVNDLIITMNETDHTAYFQGLTVAFKAANTNTGAVTLDLNSIGAASLLSPTGAALNAGAINQGFVYHVVYNGANFHLTGINTSLSSSGDGFFSANDATVTPTTSDSVAIKDQSDSDSPKFSTIAALQTLIGSSGGLFSASDATATPADTDLVSWQDVSDSNNPKKSTFASLSSFFSGLFSSGDTTTSPATGDLVHFQDVSDSNNPKKATITDILALGGSRPEHVFSSEQTESDVSSVEIALPSGAEIVKIVMENVRAASDNVDMRLTLSESGTPVTASGSYEWRYEFMFDGNVQSSGSSSQTYLEIATALGNGSSEHLYGEIYLIKPRSSSDVTVISGWTVCAGLTNGQFIRTAFGGSRKNTAEDNDELNVFLESGNISGTFKVFVPSSA